jgi:hypothetical protein
VDSAHRTPHIVSTIRTILGGAIDHLDPGARASLVERLTAVAAAEAALERERCVGVCRERVELWSGTLLAQSSVPTAREEARSRADEAAYIADLLAPVDAGEPEADA